MPQMSQEDIAKLISQQLPQHLQSMMQEAQQKQQAAKNEEMIQGFVQKLRSAEEKHPGLEEKLGNYDYKQGSGMTEIVMAANQLENTADIMQEVIEHPNKMANLITLAKDQPYALQQAMQALSASIKRNQEAVAQEQESKDPMSRLKPSPQAGADNGAMSVNDFRQMFRT
jgi:predicted  nucleic acid-binding Zn-ribbon protein